MQGWLMREVERLARRGTHALPRLLSRAEQWLIWRDCAAAVSRELDLLSRVAVADGLQRASALAAEWDIDLSRRQMMPGAEGQLLYEAERAVEARCSALGASRLQSFLPQLPAGDSARLMFRGFTMPPPRLRALGLASSATYPDQHQAAVRAVLAADEVEELELIAAWCRSRIDAQPDARILVLLSGDPGARERLLTLVRQAIDPRAWIQSSCESEGSAAPHAGRLDGLAIIEGGETFSESPVIAHALESLAWAANERADFTRVSEWLRAPFWETPTDAARARLDLWLREARQPGNGQIDFLALLQEAPAPLHPVTRELLQRLQHAAGILSAGRLSPREWSERLRAALLAMGWPGNHRRNSREEQTLMRFQELLDEFGQLTASSGAIGRSEAIRLFGELARATAFRPADDDAVVTISPQLIEPVVHYDAIWVAGLSADVFPQPVQPDPFVPLGLQRMAGVPAASAATRLQEAQRLLASWQAGTRELVLSVPRRCQDLQLMPSPLLAP
ncbi:MAG TPA: hypothetical protein VEY89_13045, partial [Candidatus Dormibacteraeota bacterium]|nr:hypothetical protein [Candidatus Dormibacteraeota bacterium]